MHVIVDFTVVPVGVGVYLSEYIAACERILQESCLTYELHANGTNVEANGRMFSRPSVVATKRYTAWVYRVSTPISN